MKYLFANVFLVFILVANAQINNTSFVGSSFVTGSTSSPQPGDIVTADFDGDGKQDVAVVNEANNTVSIFRNTSSPGTITFATKIDSSTGTGPGSIKAADIDGDGRPDIILGHWTSSFISIYRNTSTGIGVISFATRMNFAAPANPAIGSVADFDGDGKLDIQTANFTPNTLSFFRNTSSSGSISFATRQDMSFTGVSPAGSGAADFDGDNKPDLAIADYNNPGYVRVYRNLSTSGTISFTTSPLSMQAGVLNNGLGLGDMDGDGKTDIATSNYNSTSVSVYRNTTTSVGSISFTSQVTYATTGFQGPHGICIRDLDNDGRNELCVSNRNSANVSVFRNFGVAGSINSSTYPQRVEFSTGSTPVGLISADIDGDGKRDLLSSNYGTNTFTVLRNVIVSSNGLVAHYSFTGNTADSSGFANNATAYSGASLSNDLNGQANKAYYFNGTSAAYIQAPAAPSLNTANMSNLLMSAWIKPASGSTGQPNGTVLMMLDPSNNSNYSLSYNLSTNKIVLDNFNGSNSSLVVSFTSKNNYPRDAWYHIAMRLDSTNNFALFINGVLDSANTVTPVRPVNPTFTIGKNPSAGVSNNWAFLGAIDDVKVYNRYVSNAEIANISNRLMAYYPFSGNAADSSGFGNHGTPYSGVSITTDKNNIASKAYYFDGTSAAYINVPASSSLNLTNLNAFTTTFWFKADSVPNIAPSNRNIFQFLGSSNASYELFYNYSTKKFLIGDWNGSSSIIYLYSRLTYSYNTWYYVTLVSDSLNNTRLYINGQRDTSINAVLFKPVNPTLQIGRHGLYSWNIQGSIDEFRFYNKALNPNEIQALYDLMPGGADIYYSKSSGLLDNVSTWGKNTDGTGASPPNFSANNAIYVIKNNSSPTINANWYITGLNTALIFGDGSNAVSVSIPAGLIIGTDSMVIRNNATITSQGSLLANKYIFEDGSTMQYMASSAQTMVATSYYTLVVFGGTKTLSGNITARNNLVILANINCNGNILTLGAGASQTGTLNYSSGYHISGKFCRWFSGTTSGNAGFFPISTAAGIYRPVQLDFTTAPSGAGTFTSEFVSSPPGNNLSSNPLLDFYGSPTAVINKVGPNGYWKITNGNGINGGSYSLSFTATGFWGISAPVSIRWVRRDNPSSAWTLNNTTGNSDTGTGPNTAPIVKRRLVTVLGGEFALAGDSSINTLPVALLNFSAGKKEDKVLLKWSSAFEQNNNYFEVERLVQNSQTAVNYWEAIGRVRGHGTTRSICNYQFTDNIPSTVNRELPAIYYRLKQVDFDGSYTYSEIASVDLKQEEEILIYPNPARNIIFATGNDVIKMVLYDLNGMLLGESTGNSINTYNYSKGVYLLKILSPSGVLCKKVILE